MFSFDFSFGAFVTGDFVEFSSASTLSFVSGWAYTKGNWFVNVDQLGGLRLYPHIPMLLLALQIIGLH
jgi:hypothetical protein